MRSEREPRRPETPNPPSPPPQADAQDREAELRRSLEDAERRGQEEPGAITILVPSRRA